MSEIIKIVDVIRSLKEHSISVTISDALENVEEVKEENINW